MSFLGSGTMFISHRMGNNAALLPQPALVSLKKHCQLCSQFLSCQIAKRAHSLKAAPFFQAT